MNIVDFKDYIRARPIFVCRSRPKYPFVFMTSIYFDSTFFLVRIELLVENMGLTQCL